MNRIIAVLMTTLVCGYGHAQEIVIGQCVPLSGALANTGVDIAFGARLAVDAANAVGGVNGHKIRLIQKDDGNQVDKTVQCTEGLIKNDNAVALIGYVGTDNVEELVKRKTLADAGIALIAPYTGSEVLRGSPNIFHVRASYADETAKIVEQFARSGLKRIAVFYQNDAFGEAGLADVETALAKQGNKIVAKG
ncbi:MAG TPA: ABC transporter substrate-binding protein, partial [Rhodocyclaceae bacterium]|nr:ABC transporter substrate-binding protein [Rhodocyclaceae bacterium]